MVVSFLESLRYAGLLWPVALLRIFMSIQYFGMAMYLLQAGYLEHPYLNEQMRLKLENLGALSSYVQLWSVMIQNYWIVASYLIICSQFLIAASYLLGYLVRPVALWAAFLSLHMYILVDAQGEKTQLFAFAIHSTFCLLGAGRCLGLDYYFYKSRRGLLW